MNIAKTFLEAAILAFFKEDGEPPIDETFSMLFDDAMRFELDHPNEDYPAVEEAGRFRVTNSTEYPARYYLKW